MLGGAASVEGTAAFAGRQQPIASEFYTEALGLTLSSLGIGTPHRHPAGTDAAFHTTLTRALALGINHLDTAIHYHAQASERAVGQTVANAIETGLITRQEIVVATQGGVNPRDCENPTGGGASLLAGIPADEVIDDHCLHPLYIERVLARSRENLNLATVDIYYLREPERHLAKVRKPVFYDRMRRTFKALEAARQRNEIGVYGVSTRQGLFRAPDHPKALDLRRLVDTARAVGGEWHGFRVVQFPLSLTHLAALTTASQRLADDTLTALAAAQALGLAIVGTGPLDRSRLLEKPLPEATAALLDPQDERTPAQTALHFARSCGVHSTVVGMSSVPHLEENMAVAHWPRLDPNAVGQVVSPERT